MKKILSLSILASAMALTACGGDSDSSGSKDTTPTNPTPTNPTPTNPTPTAGTCEVSGTNVYATTAGCTYSHPNVNSGEAIKYTCTADQRVQSGGINSRTITINGITIMCKP